RARKTQHRDDKAALLGGGALLGLLQDDPEAWFKAGHSESPDANRIEALLAQRQQARAARDFAAADAIRQQLTDIGIEIEDGAQGTRWQTIKR
ncbi:MAG: cysteine--tRNA ligase, partial [Xanthomonadales bacterium]|nr:cysteine--tRNA ligase [Xanthomonadales bacterium]